MQFIGELDARGGGDAEQAARPVLRARVARCVDGLDLALYEEALTVRRQFEAASAQAASGSDAPRT
jgi:hypothetical protein